jgi:dodecin
MAGKAGSAESVYKIVEVIGTSTKSWDDAAKNAVETAAGTLRDLRIAEIVKLDMKVEDGKVQAYRARVLLSFKYQGGGARTHTILRSLDFESSASASSATPANICICDIYV